MVNLLCFIYFPNGLISLVQQIQELIIQVVQQKVKDVELLPEIQTSLKDWVPRLQNLLSTRATCSKNQPEQILASMNNIASSRNEELISDALDIPCTDNLDFRVSPSPLVSWRADGVAGLDQHGSRLN